MKTLAHSTPEHIVEAFELFVAAGASNPPTLPEFRKAVDDLERQQGLMINAQNKAIEGRMTRGAADAGFRNIMGVLKR